VEGVISDQVLPGRLMVWLLAQSEVYLERKARMTIIVDVKPEVQAELARQAAAHGRAIEAHVARLLEEAVHQPTSASELAWDKERAQAAAARIRELRKGVTLGGMTIRQLIDEGRP